MILKVKDSVGLTQTATVRLIREIALVLFYLAAEYQQPNHENNYVRTVGRDSLARLRFPVCLAASHVQKTRAHSPQVRLRHSHSGARQRARRKTICASHRRGSATRSWRMQVHHRLQRCGRRRNARSRAEGAPTRLDDGTGMRCGGSIKDDASLCLDVRKTSA